MNLIANQVYAFLLCSICLIKSTSYGQETSTLQTPLRLLDPFEALNLSLPGIPGEDFPILSIVPETKFSCDDRLNGGLYSDPETQCQVFHICGQSARGGPQKYSFLCPNGTIFNQEYLICDWWFNFDCDEAENLYSVNERTFDLKEGRVVERTSSLEDIVTAASSRIRFSVFANATSPFNSPRDSFNYKNPSLDNSEVTTPFPTTPFEVPKSIMQEAPGNDVLQTTSPSIKSTPTTRVTSIRDLPSLRLKTYKSRNGKRFQQG